MLKILHLEQKANFAYTVFFHEKDSFVYQGVVSKSKQIWPTVVSPEKKLCLCVSKYLKNCL